MPPRKRHATAPHPANGDPGQGATIARPAMGGGGGTTKSQEQTRREQNEDRAKSNAITVSLRAHLNEIMASREMAMDPREKTLDRLLGENDRLHEQATTAAQSLLASRAFAELTSCARRQATKLQTGLKNYDTASFVNKIKARMSGDARAEEGDVTAPLDFASLGGSLWRYYHRAPAVDFMYGLTDIQPRAPVVRKAPTGPRAGSARGGVAARPENVVDKDKLDKTETDLQIEVMQGELLRRGGSGAPFYAFLVDPDSFSRSVENIFHSSFLIKDGRARLVIDAQGEDDAPMENDQTILRFDYDKWEEVKATYSIDAVVFPSNG
ncbi:hypothetical protein I4F81_009160 [Pyropia yezoensis]|uniref:Uncharacterized protein n=1 Tax=Pyropia yezoensis TaxID=2788 RepID=A0ACC3CA35_PYRYE|nr:hypothetical protein I4F81_009160 [Neopyropia yezoensis]